MKLNRQDVQDRLYLVESTFMHAILMERDGNEQNIPRRECACRRDLFAKVVGEERCAQHGRMPGAVVLERAYDIFDDGFSIFRQGHDAHAEKLMRSGSE